MSGLMPAYILREWSDDGKLLHGGFVYLYESGTLTPKAAYTDATLSTELPNPVPLDTGGAADIFLGEGAYRVLITNSTGSPVRPYIDGITGSGGSSGLPGDVTSYSVEVYNDLRALLESPDLVYIAGRTAQGDGGEGWFQRLPGASTPDDDGVTLQNVDATVYRRIFSGNLDPRWYGVAYGSSADQKIPAARVVAASVALNKRAEFAGTTTLLQDLPIPAYADIVCTIDGIFVGGSSAISVTFASFSRFTSDGIAFGANVSPKFSPSVTDAIRLSWMGGSTNDEMMVKLAGSLAPGFVGTQTALIDRSVTVSSVPVFAAPWIVDWKEGAIISIDTAGAAVSFDQISYQGVEKIVSYSGASGTVKMGIGPTRPEWFGAVSDGVTDDSLAFLAAAKTGNVALRSARTYFLGALWGSTPSPLSIAPDGAAITTVAITTGKTLGTGALSLRSTRVSIPTGSWFAGTFLAAVDSEIPATYTATVKSITGCTITGDAYFPILDGFPKLYNGHIDLPLAQLLGTDTNGKLITGAANLPKSKQLVGTDASGNVIDAGANISLTKLGLAGLLFSDWAHTAISGTVTLTNPLRLVYMVNNASAVGITMPTMSDNTQPNICIMFTTGSGAVTVTGNAMNRPSSANSITFNVPTIFYYDYQTSIWNWLG